MTEKTRGAEEGVIVDPLFDFDARDHDVVWIDFDKKNQIMTLT